MLFQNPPEDSFVREILDLRRRHSGLLRPKFHDTVTTPITIETREPDLQASAKISKVYPDTISVLVDHPETFNIGDGVMILQNRSHETLVSKGKVLDIVDSIVYLGGTSPYNLAVVVEGDLLVKEAEFTSIVLSYVPSDIPRYSKRELEEMRNAWRDDPIDPPSHVLSRMPGREPFGITSRHFPQPESPIPKGKVVLPIGIKDGAHIEPHGAGWMLRRIIDEDLAFQRRWRHWHEMQSANGMPRTREIPHQRFDQFDNGTMERIKLCLNFIDPNWSESHEAALKVIDVFFDWLLWSLGHPSVPEFPVALRDSRAHDFMIQSFSPGRLILYPSDYFGSLLASIGYPGVMPIEKANHLVKSLFPGRRNDFREMLLLDPQCSSGALMLAASNYTYQYQAVTTDPLMAKATILNAYFYVPWCIFPFEWMTTPDPGATLTTSLMLMRGSGIDPRYFNHVRLSERYEQYLPVALVEQCSINELADWLQSRSLPSVTDILGLPEVMQTQRLQEGDDPLVLPSAPHFELPSAPHFELPSTDDRPQLPGQNNLLPPSSDS